MAVSITILFITDMLCICNEFLGQPLRGCLVTVVVVWWLLGLALGVAVMIVTGMLLTNR